MLDDNFFRKRLEAVPQDNLQNWIHWNATVSPEYSKPLMSLPQRSTKNIFE